MHDGDDTALATYSIERYGHDERGLEMLLYTLVVRAGEFDGRVWRDVRGWCRGRCSKES
jgi:hypothetical protein